VSLPTSAGIRAPGGKPSPAAGRRAIPLQKVFDRRLERRLDFCPFIFHRHGVPLKERRVRPAFYAALALCKIPTGRANGFVPYDTKKTSMGLMVDAGLTVEEIMAFSGHKNRAMVERYIVRNADRQARAVEKRDAYLTERLADKGTQIAAKGSDSASETVN
jgi:integrase